ncbi:HIT family protein [Marinicauda salina]|uniref:HIT family protein n=1 Tax=Marinicauda salina TaxID=2135793 RepID=A0A2U2BR59_9PROT|nr:HIT family protein [Marinicauda salina]PWE16486.1 HIT family protein [Marinicauda salina]
MSLHGTYDDDNIFAKILRGEAPAVKVYEDDHVLAFMDVFPQTEGHTLVLPKEKARNLLELSDEAAREAITRVKKVAKAVEAALEPDGVVVTQFNGAPAGQSVFHIHFHIIPRWEGRGLGRHGGSGEMADTGELEKLAEKIRAKL